MKRLLYILPFVFSVLVASGQSFTASVSKNAVAVGEQFKLSFKLEAKGDNFVPPDLSAFRVYSGPNQSSSMKWVNGVVSNSLSFSYILSAKSEGKLSIGPAKIKVGGDYVSSNGVEVTATKGRQQSQTNNQSPQNTSSGNQSQAPAGNGMDQNVFLRVQVSNAAPYEGEQIVATYKLYYRIDVVNIEAEKLPSFKGFSSYPVELKNNTLPQEVIKGVRYNVAAIQQVVLFPQRAGELIIDPLELKTIVRVMSNRRPRSIFDQFFGSYQDLEHRCKSLRLKLNVKALPKNGRPSNFDGAVGSYSFTTKLDKDSLGANEAMNLSVVIEGRGDIQLLPEPKFKFPPDFEVYDPKTNTNSNVGSSGIRGKKSYEYLIIPRHSGLFEIEGEGFSFFDPSKGKYVEVKPENFEVQVGKVDEEDISAFRARTKEDIKFMGKDIRYIKSSDSALSNGDEAFFRSGAYWLLLFTSPLLFVILFQIQKRVLKSNADIALVRKRKAASIANKHLSAAKKALNENSDQLYEELSIALNGYLSDKLGISTAEMNRDHIVEALSQRHVSTDLIKDLGEVLDECDMARFAPGGAANKQMLFDRSKELIRMLESQIS